MAVDAAASHPWAFVFMLALVLIFGVGRIAKETKTSVQKWTSFVHAWMFSYLALLAILMSVTTAMALAAISHQRLDSSDPGRSRSIRGVLPKRLLL